MDILKHFGFAVDNNIYAATIIRTVNYFIEMNDKQVSICSRIKCADPLLE